MAVIIAEILISLLAVFGLYAAVRLLCIRCFAPKELATALMIDHESAGECAEWLLYCARESGIAFTARRVVVVIDGRLVNAAALMDTFTALGAVCCITKTEEGGA